MITLEKIKNHPQVLEFIRQTHITLKAIGYTEHGLPHANLVSQRSKDLAQEIGLNQRTQELAAITGFCHDMGNFFGRTQHHYWGALLFHQIFQNDFSPREIGLITQAIVNHDKYTVKLTNTISAIIILSDKSEMRRSRVITKSLRKIKKDIHDRVNYAVTKSALKVNKKKKQITLVLKIDTNFVPIIEYFEIFTERMAYCRRAAAYLGYKFNLVINNFKLL
ncbi:phosphohydrolase [Patescibacteria group bacterium]|nr:phosphohydrolase [Patescibacteria group bacterium]